MGGKIEIFQVMNPVNMMFPYLSELADVGWVGLQRSFKFDSVRGCDAGCSPRSSAFN
jgi:hypothetical protein